MIAGAPGPRHTPADSSEGHRIDGDTRQEAHPAGDGGRYRIVGRRGSRCPARGDGHAWRYQQPGRGDPAEPSCAARDPTLYEALFADREDITLGNPFGPYARGKAAVSKTLAGAAAKYRDGEVVGVDLVATYASGSIACVVEVEHDRAKVGDGNEPAEFHVRVTSVYERLKGQWRLVHRHADPITTPRPAESVLGR
jgi:ketosteroid isomerase-like protein